MTYWLLKTEPSDYSIDDLQTDKITSWTGIRNYQARNFIRDKMRIGDSVFIYHSSCKQVGIAGIATVVTKAYPDPDQFDTSSKYFDAKAQTVDPKWFVVDVQFKLKAAQIYSLKDMKLSSQLCDLVLLKQSRLSVSPVDSLQWEYIKSKL